MALAEDRTPDTGTSGPPGDVAWSNPENATACDGVYTTSGPLTIALPSTELLALSTYDVSDLNPSGILTGIEMHCEALIDQGSANFVNVNLFRRGLGTGENKAATPVALSTVETDHQFGGEGDMWGSNFRTVADFMDPNTGFQIRCRRAGAPNPTVSVDCLTLTCYFVNARPFVMRFAFAPLRPTLPVHRH